MAIKNIIFDLGGVFLDINYQKTKQAFIDLGIANFDDFYQQSFSNPLFSELERGVIDAGKFYENFRETTGSNASDAEIENAWNAMLGSFRLKSVAILPELKKKYKIYLLSNTNAIHHQSFSKTYRDQTGNDDFDNHFHKAYYSHVMNERKPDAASYEYILKENGLKKEETLFVDDTPKNIDGAIAAGIRVLHLQDGTQLEDAIKDIDNY